MREVPSSILLCSGLIEVTLGVIYFLYIAVSPVASRPVLT